jgi:hypothetical protein
LIDSLDKTARRQRKFAEAAAILGLRGIFRANMSYLRAQPGV